MDRILLSPEKGGLTSTGLVYRYDTDHVEDGLLHLVFRRDAANSP